MEANFLYGRISRYHTSGYLRHDTGVKEEFVKNSNGVIGGVLVGGLE